jgi:hypothetical protein
LTGFHVEIPVQTLHSVDIGRPYSHTLLVVRNLCQLTGPVSGSSLRKTEINAILERETVGVEQDEDRIESEAGEERGTAYDGGTGENEKEEYEEGRTWETKTSQERNSETGLNSGHQGA